MAAGALVLAAGLLLAWVGVGLYGVTAALPGEMRTTGTVVALEDAGTARDATLARSIVAYYDSGGISHEVTSAVAEPSGARAVGDRMDVAYTQSRPDGARVLAYADDPVRARVGLALALVGSVLVLVGILGLAWAADILPAPPSRDAEPPDVDGKRRAELDPEDLRRVMGLAKEGKGGYR